MKRLLLLLPLVAISLPCNAAQAQSIYDTDGDEVTSNGHYHILPADSSLGDGYGLRIRFLRKLVCPMHVVLFRKSPGYVGLPVHIVPGNTSGDSGGALRLSSDVKMAFNFTYTTCIEALRWHIHVREPTTGQLHVSAGNPRERPPSFEVFRVEKHAGTPEGYKLASCAGREYMRPCRDLVLYDYMGLKWLTMSDEQHNNPFVVVFKKCTTSTGCLINVRNKI